MIRFGPFHRVYSKASLLLVAKCKTFQSTNQYYLMCHYRPLFFFIFVFSIQFTVNKCSIQNSNRRPLVVSGCDCSANLATITSLSIKQLQLIQTTCQLKCSFSHALFFYRRLEKIFGVTQILGLKMVRIKKILNIKILNIKGAIY